MVVHKHEDGQSIECLYDSSNVLASKYVLSERKLAVIFSSGRQYVYHNVSNVEYRGFESSESQGKYIHSTLKKHKSELAEDLVDTSLIKEQIENIKNEG
jgi:hypothetical protein